MRQGVVGCGLASLPCLLAVLYTGCAEILPEWLLDSGESGERGNRLKPLWC